MNEKHLQSTRYCDHSHPSIQTLSRALTQRTEDDLHFIKKAFFHVRDEIRFGADIWKVKASDTLKKCYGACYNKNLLFMAILRSQGIPCVLGANPMSRKFTKPNAGFAHLLISNPFYHCFTRVCFREKWIHLDPTLDKDNYETFFKPLEKSWDIDWNRKGMTPLYSESIIGEPIEIKDIDAELTSNLNSWFIFKHEPDFLLKFWLWAGNRTMWEKIDKKNCAKIQHHPKGNV